MSAFLIRLDNTDWTSIDAASLNVAEAVKVLKLKGQDRLIAVYINGKLSDMNSPLPLESELKPVFIESDEGLDILRHSAAHVMAMAVRELFPGVKVAIGPAIEDGFYYDFGYERPFKEEDLDLIEQRMEEIIKANLPFRREIIKTSEALTFFREACENYKAEIIDDITEEEVSFYSIGSFVDLCRGPHIPSTGIIKAFKLLKVAGAYWRGDEKRPMLSRIYGTAFVDKKALKAYLYQIEEAKKRNHAKLGPQLGLFSIHDEIGSGLVVWHPKGAMLRYLLENFLIKEHYKRGYELARGPEILRTDLWSKSGHLDNYRENMYFTEVDESAYGLKPMNCLSHMFIYGAKIRSYRDLPQRYFELGTVHRHERSGVLNGLLRVREFTQDDAHILCAPEQLPEEIKGVLDFVRDIMAVFGFKYELEISTRPGKSIGSDEMWELATEALKKAVEKDGLPYEVNFGDGAFYGPKIDVKLSDILGRKWQCATIQCDFALPERFDLTYIDKDGRKCRPAMIHRTILGSIERFIGILIENYAGAFPLWIAPVQAVVLTVTDRNTPHGEKVLSALLNSDIRVEGDFRNEKLGAKIREAQMNKVPIMLVVGDKEVENDGVAPRLRSGENMPFMNIKEIVGYIKEETRQRR